MQTILNIDWSAVRLRHLQIELQKAEEKIKK